MRGSAHGREGRGPTLTLAVFAPRLRRHRLQARSRERSTRRGGHSRCAHVTLCLCLPTASAVLSQEEAGRAAVDVEPRAALRGVQRMRRRAARRWRHGARHVAWRWQERAGHGGGGREAAVAAQLEGVGGSLVGVFGLVGVLAGANGGAVDAQAGARLLRRRGRGRAVAVDIAAIPLFEDSKKAPRWRGGDGRARCRRAERAATPLPDDDHIGGAVRVSMRATGQVSMRAGEHEGQHEGYMGPRGGRFHPSLGLACRLSRRTIRWTTSLTD